MDWCFGLDKWVIWLTLTVTAVYLIHVVIRRRVQWMKLPPGPWGLPIIGSYRQFRDKFIITSQCLTELGFLWRGDTRHFLR